MVENSQEWVMVENSQEWVMVENSQDWVMVENSQDWVMAENSQDWVMAENCRDFPVCSAIPTSGALRHTQSLLVLKVLSTAEASEAVGLPEHTRNCD
jgi:hypothetical protein